MVQNDLVWKNLEAQEPEPSVKKRRVLGTNKQITLMDSIELYGHNSKPTRKFKFAKPSQGLHNTCNCTGISFVSTAF